MGTKIRLWNTFGWLLFLVVFVASLGVFYFTRSGDGGMDFIINLAFEAVVAIFLVVYIFGCAAPAARMTAALNRVKEDILCAEEDPKALWARYSKNTAPFGNRRLDARYGAYLRELRRLYKQNAITADCDIEDYINEDVLYAAVNKSFCDQIGGIMSGLGILFTFIGLVYGLRNFDATTVDMMQTSTQALMAGIKIAFLTSIFGLIYSLLINLFYRRLVKMGLETVYDFQETYTEYVRPSNAHAAENAMLRLQTEQNAALERFGNSVGEQVSEAIITLMKPTVDQMHDTIVQYTTVAIEDQRAGMEKVVRYFLESMNTSLGNIFIQLKTRIDELNIWETDMIGSIRAMTEDMGHTREDLIAAQASAQDITRTMAAYTEAIEKLTAAQSGVIAQMAAFVAQSGEAQAQEAAYLEKLSAASQAAADNTRDSLRVAHAVEDIAAQFRADSDAGIRVMEEAGVKIFAAAESVRSMSDSVVEDVSAAAQRLASAADSMEGGLRRTVDESLSQVDDSLERMAAAVDKLNAASGSVAQAMKALPKTASSVDSDFKATAKAIDTELKLLLTAVSDTQKVLNRFNADLERRVSG